MTIENEITLADVLHLGGYIGNTPLYEIRHLLPHSRVKVFAKLEWQQFGGSVKSRPAYQIIYDAIEQGFLGQGQELLDASSGNTAIAYASIGSRLGISTTICLPENASWERKILLKALGANVIETSKFGSTDEAQEKAIELSRAESHRYFLADQYANSSNWKAHYLNTGHEIWEGTKGQITHFITGLGTSGSFTGVSRLLKERNPQIRTIALQPDSALHGLEGWKDMQTAKIPKIYDKKLSDETRYVDTYQAYETIQLAAKKEGLLLSPSSAANLNGALKLAQELDEGVVVTIFPDNAEKYSEVLKTLF